MQELSMRARPGFQQTTGGFLDATEASVLLRANVLCYQLDVLIVFLPLILQIELLDLKVTCLNRVQRL